MLVFLYTTRALTYPDDVVMREEIETGMRLLGATSVDQLTPDLVRYVDRDPPFRFPPKL
jgi:hypothetical protein